MLNTSEKYICKTCVLHNYVKHMLNITHVLHMYKTYVKHMCSFYVLNICALFIC